MMKEMCQDTPLSDIGCAKIGEVVQQFALEEWVGLIIIIIIIICTSKSVL